MHPPHVHSRSVWRNSGFAPPLRLISLAPIKMIIPSGSQSQSKMLRQLFVLVLALGGFLATSHPTQNSVNVDPISFNCSHANSHACGARSSGENRLGNVNATESSRVREVLDNGIQEIEEVTGRKKKGKGYAKMLMYFIGATKITWLYFMLHAVAAVAGKALIVGKVALAIGIALLLKKSTDHGEKVSYEIIKHPHHSYVQTHSSSIDYDHHGFGESGYSHRRRRRILR